MADESSKPGSLSNISKSDAGDSGPGNNTLTNTGRPTGQSVSGQGAESYPSPGQEADRGDGSTSRTEYGTGMDAPGTGGNEDMETMKNDVARSRTADLGSNLGHNLDTGTASDMGNSLGVGGTDTVGDNSAGEDSKLNSMDV